MPPFVSAQANDAGRWLERLNPTPCAIASLAEREQRRSKAQTQQHQSSKHTHASLGNKWYQCFAGGTKNRRKWLSMKRDVSSRNRVLADVVLCLCVLHVMKATPYTLAVSDRQRLRRRIT